MKSWKKKSLKSQDKNRWPYQNKTVLNEPNKIDPTRIDVGRSLREN